ncbi:P pilus assembly protein, chaperone PapD [Calothrix sp. PCC 6303]|uniref:P pilus assembly protein, chaperone PapD n=1 Tax=Calothrix sp. PCC 6303 TaxID=1170562 RepID=UPI0011819D02|nr:P pilus assembly protein, chaperone PapD [Calothrix sp. PCC 6303]
MRSALNFTSLLLSTVLISGGVSQAQVKLSPLRVEIQSVRGQAKGVINITNTSDETFRARVYAESFTYDKEKGFQTIPSNPNDLRPYLQFSPREMVVPPGTTRKVRMNAVLAPNLPDGEYRAMIFTEPLKQTTVTDGKGITTKIITRVGSAFFVKKGDVRPSLAAQSASWNTTTKQLKLLVRNSGKASTYPSIKWRLKQGGTVIKAGESASTGILLESDRNITLNTSRQDKDALALSPGIYELSGEMIWGEDKKKQPFKLNLTVPPKNVIRSLQRNRR